MSSQKDKQKVSAWQDRLTDLLAKGGYQSSWWCGFSGTKWTEVLYLETPPNFKATIWLEFADPKTCSGPTLRMNADWYTDFIGEWRHPCAYLERDFARAEAIADLVDLEPWYDADLFDLKPRPD